ncbi:MAG: hypothetical protein MK434_07635 [SAR324 cluster bacterium]|nr:hypothetical protein [SAR324 cluster bacterium]
MEDYLQRSKQTEAKVSLSANYIAQKIYFVTNQTYAYTMSKLDVQLESGGSARYTITLSGNSPPSPRLLKATKMMIQYWTFG